MHGLGFISSWEDLHFYLTSPFFLVLAAFQLWMLVHAVRNGEFMWAVFIFLFPGVNAILYYIFVYRQSGGATQGFELPGAYDRRRIKTLQGQIHHLDKAHHHLELGNVYFQQGKLEKAAACFRAAMERDPDDLEAPAHLGQCLLRQHRAAKALPLLEAVCARDPRHEYGHTLMALAEAQTAVGQTGRAMVTWSQVVQDHDYARARVQYAELLSRQGQTDQARAQVEETLADDAHAPAYQRRRDRVWMRRARSLLRRLPRPASGRE